VSGVPAAQLPVLVLTGPTGAGKSEWAERLAAHAAVEIVSVDSALVYRGMDIGTAKPTRELRARVPHHLIDICDPAESYSAGRFVRDALAAIDSIQARGRVPLLVGGTMLYLKALLHGLAPLPTAAPELRARLDEEARLQGWPALHAQLKRLDPQAAARIAPADGQRIQRALEVWHTLEQPISQLQRATVSPLAGRMVRYWALAPPDRGLLHARIARRLEAMMAAGFLEEVAVLHGRRDLTARHPAMRAVGYRQLWAHLDGAMPLNAAVERALAATRQLAKRQLTWIRAEPLTEWLDPGAGPMSWIRDISRQLATLGL
jgi:tRNA dimethylallyltransferase